MKCPNCGKEIPEGSLFCEYCAAEIKIVPEYETKVEEQISSGMEGVRKTLGTNTVEEDTNKENYGKGDSGRKRTLRYFNSRPHLKIVCSFIIGGIVAVVILIAVYFGTSLGGEKDVSFYVGQAYDIASKGNYEQAAKEIDKALEELEGEEESSSDSWAGLYLLKSEYILKEGDAEEAANVALSILELDGLSEENEVDAYGQLIACYASLEEYSTIAELLSECSSETVIESYPQYVLYEPEFSAEEGEYEDLLTLELTDGGEGSIFYTLDGSEPTTSSSLYTSPIDLTEGTYIVSAVYINHFGLESDIVTKTYTIVSSIPDAPTIFPNSGTYAKQMTITASLSPGEDEIAGQDLSAQEREEGTAEDSSSGEDEEEEAEETISIYYTTDGTDPTRESNLYTDPFAMPEGESVYRFAAINEDGVSSEVVERRYNYKITSVLSEEDGVNYILIALINRGEIVDTIGTLPGGTARFNFTYTGLEQIQNFGNFLMYTETLVDGEGNAAETGRVYAVNATNGTVNLYSDGELTPIG